MLESTRAIPWKIDWATLGFAYIGPQIEDLLGWAPRSWATVRTGPIACARRTAPGSSISACRNRRPAWTATLSGIVRRQRDLLCRFAGEEFVLLLPDTDEATALAVAWRCLDLIDKALIPHAGAGPGKRLTLSAGVNTIVPGEHDGVLPFIALADRRLYLAKERGRARVVADP